MFKKFEVVNISISSTKTFIHLTLKPPKGYHWRSGQYAFINIPSISKFQWHPFSIASSQNGRFLNFMIKRAGDWTGELIDKFYQIRKDAFMFDNNIPAEDQHAVTIDNIIEPQYQDELREFLMQMNLGNKAENHDQEEMDNSHQTQIPYNPKFPTINVSYPISAPAQMAATRKRII